MGVGGGGSRYVSVTASEEETSVRQPKEVTSVSQKRKQVLVRRGNKC